MLSGGSTVSASLNWFAITLTEQTTPSGRLLVGSSVIDEPGEPLTAKLSGVPVGHSSVKELVVAVTGSLKLTTTFVFTATWSAASAGDVVVTVGAASCVANEKLVFAAGWSGGSPVSTSLMFAATAVTVQFAVGRSESGLSVIVSVPEPLTWNVCGLPSQTIVNELKSTVTGSLKKTWMFVLAATSVALSVGELPVTAGAASSVNELELTMTDSLKFTTMFVFTAT